MHAGKQEMMMHAMLFFTELEKEDVNGIYMRDIIREEMNQK